MLVAFVVVVVLCAIAWFWLTSSGASHFSSFKSDAPYVAQYKGSRVRGTLPSFEKARGTAQGMPQCKFFLSAKSQLQRDYILVVDRSGSMGSGRRWAEACTAVKTLAPYVCKFDPDGVTLIFFDHNVDKFENVKTPLDVEKLFDKFKPRGSTNLALALHEAFVDHFRGKRGATTVLVVTDGCPDSKTEVERIIRRAANSIEEVDEISVSLVQIGDDPSATQYLQHLDDTLEGVKFDIVDTITAEECSKISFAELVARSIYD